MPGGADTLIFLDVDGVLNFGLRDGDRGALFLNQSNVRWARRFREGLQGAEDHRDTVDKMCSAADQYGDLVCSGTSESSEVLVRRLVHILKAAGDRPQVVLSSSWRKPKNMNRVERLEREISRHLGREFEFDGRTDVAQEFGGADRLRLIGDYLGRHCALRGAAAERPLRVLILDDFFVGALDGWPCGGRSMYDERSVEAFVRLSAPATMDVAVRLLHCYKEWVTPCGYRAQAGAGISRQDVERARAFLQDAEPPPRELSVAAMPRRRRSVGPMAVKWGSGDFSPFRSGQAMASLVVCWTGLVSLSPFMCLHV